MLYAVFDKMAQFQRSAVLCVALGFFMGLITSSLFDSVCICRGRPEASNTHIECQYPRTPTTRGIVKAVKEEIAKSSTLEKVETAKSEISTSHKLEPKMHEPHSPRKILLDCGANVASTVLLFRETYPGGSDYIIHSFEIDVRLSPYFKPYNNHHLHCPIGVAGKNGNMTAYLEMVWSPSKGVSRRGSDYQCGGGSLFVSEQERNDKMTGGYRLLSYRKTVPVIDLSQWIMDTFSKDDYIIFKLDVEGAEYEVLRKMVDTGALAYIDKYYGEFHDWQPTGWSQADKDRLQRDVKKAGLNIIDWIGEKRNYNDFEKMNPIKVPSTTPGVAGSVYSACASGSVTLSVTVGMNHKRAHRAVETLRAYKYRVPITLFVYGDFVQMFPETVKSWAENFNIGIREDAHNPLGHLELMPGPWVRMGLISTILRLEEIGIKASYYLPTVKGEITKTITDVAKSRGLRIIKPAVEFPAKEGSGFQLTWDNYYKNMDVERVPKALRKIHDALAKNSGGVLTLDSDLHDTYMISVFLLDYLVETSEFKIVTMDECIAKSM